MTAPTTKVETVLAIEYLVEVVQSLSLAQDLDEITAIVCSAARRLTNADGASFIVRDGEQCFYADEDAFNPLWKGKSISADSCISGWVIGNSAPLTIPDIYKDPRTANDFYLATFVHSMAIVPIRSHSPIGAIEVYWAEPHQPTPEQFKLLQALANYTAVAMEKIRIHQELEERVREHSEQLDAANEELRVEAVRFSQMEAKVQRLSLTDKLTGLSNRRGFLLLAEQMLKVLHRVPTHGWLFYINLDGLNEPGVKEIDDQTEPLASEANNLLVLNAAKVLRESFRDSDVIGRIGSDEFVVFATGSSTPADEIKERLNQNIAHYNRCFPDQPPLSISVGVIRCDQHSLHTIDDMIYEADAALYIERRRKRSRLRDMIID